MYDALEQGSSGDDCGIHDDEYINHEGCVGRCDAFLATTD